MTFNIIVVLVLISILITILNLILDIIHWLKEDESNITLGDYIQYREEQLVLFIIPAINVIMLIIQIFTFFEKSSLNLRKLFFYE